MKKFEIIKNPPLSIIFTSHTGQKLGEFKEVDGKLTFEGNVDESGKMFVDFICKSFNASRPNNQDPEAGGRKMMKWVSVEDKLPNDLDDVLFFTTSQDVKIGFYDKKRSHWAEEYDDGCVGDIHHNVTHWMPLELPQNTADTEEK